MALAAGMVVLGVLVEVDVVEASPGDLLGAGEDGVERGLPDQVGQTADHPGGALVQVGVQPQQDAGPVGVQAQGLLQRGDQGLPGVPLVTV